MLSETQLDWTKSGRSRIGVIFSIRSCFRPLSSALRRFDTPRGTEKMSAASNLALTVSAAFGM